MPLFAWLICWLLRFPIWDAVMSAINFRQSLSSFTFVRQQVWSYQELVLCQIPSFLHVGPLEEGPISPIQNGLSRISWAKARPPGAPYPRPAFGVATHPLCDQFALEDRTRGKQPLATCLLDWLRYTNSSTTRVAVHEVRLRSTVIWEELWQEPLFFREERS